MTRRTARQAAASRRNLEKARAARQKDLKYALGKSGKVPLGYIQFKRPGSSLTHEILKVRPVISENASLVRDYAKGSSKGKNPAALRSAYIKFLKGTRIKK